MATKYGPSTIDPGEWLWVGNFYQGSSEEAQEVFQDDHEELLLQLNKLLGTLSLNDGQGLDLWDESSDGEGLMWSVIEHHNNGGCASCGARYAYGAVFGSRAQTHDSNEWTLLAVGHDCAFNLFGLADLAAKQKREVAKRVKRNKIRAEFEAQLEADADLADAFSLSFEGAPIDHPKDGTYLHGTGAGIVYDILHKGRRYGSISERQADLVKKIAREHRERQAQRAEKEAELGPVEDVPEGRVEITGIVISHKWQENDYGDVHKMLVESENGRWRVWGTVPAKIEVDRYSYDEGRPVATGHTLKGSRVRFSANVEASKDDSTFGFYKRPTKPELLEPGKEEE